MNMINMPALEMKYYLDANTRLAKEITAAVRKYFSENAEVILGGFSLLNGNVSYRSYSAVKSL